MKLRYLAATVLVFGLTTACGTTPGTAVGTALPATTPATAPIADSAEVGIDPATLDVALGERIEIRPGVFATTTARVVPLAVDQQWRDGALVDAGPKVDHVTITIAYENQGDQPLAGMGTAELGAATLNGEVGTLAFVGDSAAMAALHPGRAGKLVETVRFPETWHHGEPIQVTVPVPALVSEVGTAAGTHTAPLSMPVMVTGTPTA